MFSPKLVEEIHKEIIRSTGGSFGIRDENLLESSLKVPFKHSVKKIYIKQL